MNERTVAHTRGNHEFTFLTSSPGAKPKGGIPGCFTPPLAPSAPWRGAWRPVVSRSVVRVRGDRTAFGHPGTAPRWTHGSKDGVGTAYAASSRLWFTLWNGIVTEVYFPTIDRPQIRDLQYLVSDGLTFFHEEKRHLLVSSIERLSKHTLGYRVTTTDPERRYAITKEIIADPHLPCLLQHTRLTGEDTWLSRLRLYTLCAPRMGGAAGAIMPTSSKRPGGRCSPQRRTASGW